MLGIHARNVLWGMTKCPRVDDAFETSNNKGHSKVKGQIGAFSYQNCYADFLNCYKCYFNQSYYD